jgi:23S rRNA (uracil1939-C5)-methyltransferase
LLNHGNDTIVYVSCNPVSLRRDADILVGGGYRLEVLGMIDMFPHTAHMESIAKFTRATPNG